ncbi:MAG: recombination regulator RecX [Pseudomonadota bacterium]
MAFGAPSLKSRALRHLARREHSRAELERKLAAHAQDLPTASAAEQIRSTLDDLAARGLQSDARVAETLLAGSGQRLGARRVAGALRAKGLDAELVDAAVAQARGGDLERARELWRRRFGVAPGDPRARARQMRFLAARGFDADVIRHVVAASDDEFAPEPGSDAPPAGSPDHEDA